MKKLLSSSKNKAIALSIIILLLFLSSVAALLLPGMLPKKDGQLYVADIYQDGVLIQSIPLLSSKESTTFRIEGKDGAFNEIEVQGTQIGMTNASCPDHLCVHRGFLSNSQIPITCLPNRVVIRIRPARPSDELDATTY